MGTRRAREGPGRKIGGADDCWSWKGVVSLRTSYVFPMAMTPGGDFGPSLLFLCVNGARGDMFRASVRFLLEFSLFRCLSLLFTTIV